MWFNAPVHYKSKKRTGRLRITHKPVVVHYGMMGNPRVDMVIVQVEYECTVNAEGAEPFTIWEDARPNDIMQREFTLKDAPD